MTAPKPDPLLEQVKHLAAAAPAPTEEQRRRIGKLLDLPERKKAS